MSKPPIKVLKAAAWLALGLGIGSGGTHLITQWASTSPPIPSGRAERESPPKAELITELLLKGEPALGSRHAPLTIVEFSDFECPCRVFHEQVLPSWKRSTSTPDWCASSTGSAAAVPPAAMPAAAAARCAGEQNRYWDLYGALFDQQNCRTARASSGSPKS